MLQIPVTNYRRFAVVDIYFARMLRFAVLTLSNGCKCYCLLLSLFKRKTVKMLFKGEMLTKAVVKRGCILQ